MKLTTFSRIMTIAIGIVGIYTLIVAIDKFGLAALVLPLSALLTVVIGTLIFKAVFKIVYVLPGLYPELDPDDLTILQVFHAAQVVWSDEIESFRNRFKRGNKTDQPH